jgi:hypothetical protein
VLALSNSADVETPVKVGLEQVSAALSDNNSDEVQRRGTKEPEPAQYACELMASAFRLDHDFAEVRALASLCDCNSDDVQCPVTCILSSYYRSRLHSSRPPSAPRPRRYCGTRTIPLAIPTLLWY